MGPVDGHRYFEGLAVAHVLGGLDDSEGQVFRAHLLECLNCRARVGELRAIAHDLADVERDERRVRAAQAIDTKRRETEEDEEEPEEPGPSARASRLTVLIGLVVIIGLSLWNFTLRSALSVQHGINDTLREAGTITMLGDPWDVTVPDGDVKGSIVVDDDQFVIALQNLDEKQVYGLYVETADGEYPVARRIGQPPGGRVYRTEKLPSDARRIVVRDPQDVDGKVGEPGEKPLGDLVFEAVP